MTDQRDPLREGVIDGEVVDDRYRVVQRIGSGGMADVYCAEDTQLGRKVALKVLHRRFAEDSEFVERFRREASAAAGLQHPNVVQVFDRGDLEGTYYIAMELLEGRTLKQLVADGPIEPQQAIDVTIHILRAARFAHKRGIIHRDIKPHNVIVDAEGRVKVTDFGIARAGASDMTETGAIMGTAAYLSPEQAQGHAVSASSDLYSIGILLYELLTGRVPFEAESAVSIALKQVSETPVAPRELNPDISPELEDVVLRALQKDPAERFADADDFIAALDAVRPFPARPDAAQRTGDFTGAYPALGLYDEEVEEERRRHRGWRYWTVALLVLLGLAAIAAGVFFLTRPDEVDVPKVVGQKADVASTRLDNLGFDVELQYLRNPDVPRDTVSKQQPNPGVSADKGSTVTVYVSSGPGQADVPDVVGSRLKAARRAIERQGFEVDVEREFSDTVKPNRVIDTRPSAQTQLDLGKTVTLIVSDGPEQAEVPDVTGLSESSATARMQAAGFEVSTTRAESTSADPGTVTTTSPRAGTVLRLGQTVTLTVAEAPEEVEVPSLVGDTLNEALQELADAGLVARQREEAVASPDEDGTVLSQRPSGGTLPEGGTVTIVVGVFDDSGLDTEPDEDATETPTPAATLVPEP